MQEGFVLLRTQKPLLLELILELDLFFLYSVLEQ